MLFITPIFIFVLGFLVIEYAESSRGSQSKLKNNNKSGRITFLTDDCEEEKEIEYTKAVPKVNDKVLRVVTYYVNYHTDSKGSDSMKLIIDNLKQLNPGIAILHKISKGNFRSVKIRNMLGNLGYDHRKMTKSETSQPFINMIVSKYPLEEIGQINFGKSGKILAVKAKVGNKEIAIIGASWEYEYDVKDQAAKIIEFLNDKIFGEYSQYVFGANAKSHDVRSLDIFKANKLRESFNAKGVPPPKYANVNDGSAAVFISPELVEDLLDTYVVDKITSNISNAPVLVDLKISENDQTLTKNNVKVTESHQKTTESRVPQSQPDFCCKDCELASIKKYFEFEVENFKHNTVIPRVNYQFLRVVNYPLDYRSGIGGINNLESIKNDLKGVDSGVIIFHGIPKDDLGGLEKIHNELEYQHRQIVTHDVYGISSMIVSKYPSKEIGKLTFGALETVLAIEVKVGNEAIAIVGASFGHASDIKGPIAKMMKLMKDEIVGKYPKYILGVSTPFHYIQTIEEFKVKGLKESFSAKGVPPPKYTNRFGFVCNSIFTSEEVVKTLLGSYILHTVSTLFLPTVIDFKINGKDEESIQNQLRILKL